MMFLLEYFYSLSSSYGVAILLLSLSVNLALLPLYYLADKWKDTDDELQNKMKHEISIIKKHYKSNEKHYYIKCIYDRYGYHPIKSISASIGFLIQIPFFFSAYMLLSTYPPLNDISFFIINDLSSPDGLLWGVNILPFAMSAINIASALVYIKISKTANNKQLYILSGLFLVLLYNSSSALLLYWTFSNVFSFFKNLIELKFNVEKFKSSLISIITYPFIFIKNNHFFIFLTKDIYAQSLILFFGTIFIYRAIPLSASDTGMYNVPYFMIVLVLVVLFVLFVSFFLILYRYLSKRMAYIFSVVFCFLALSGLIYSFVIPYETIPMMSLGMPEFKTPAFYIENKAIIKVISYGSFIALFFIFTRIKSALLMLMLVSNAMLLSQTIIKGINHKEIDKIYSKKEQNLSPEQLEEKLKKAYSFSKESNTIVIMMDMFQGNILSDVIQKKPNIKNGLQGFVHYENTISYGSGTWISIGALIGGDEFHITNYRKYKNKSKSFIESSYSNTLNLAEKYNHSYALYNPQYVECDFFKNQICLDTSDVKIHKNQDVNKIQKRKNDRESQLIETSILFSKISFVFSIPNHLKSFVATRIDYFQNLGNYFSNLSYYSQLKNMHTFANANSDKKTFKFFQNGITHRRWSLNDECKITTNSSKHYDGAFNSSYCSMKELISFFDKLKDLKIFNNTKIIIVSDHGAYGISSKSNKAFINQSNALLLVKDFNSIDNFSVSNKFLTNSDTYGLIKSGISQNKNTELDMIKNYKKRSLLYISKVNPQYSYDISKAYIVKDNLFDKNNWKELSKQYTNNLYYNKP